MVKKGSPAVQDLLCAEYGKQILLTGSTEWANEFGRGFAARKLASMVVFAGQFPNLPLFLTLSGKLTCSHFVELIVSLRPIGTSDWRLTRYQLLPPPPLSSDGRLSPLNAYPREPRGESTGDGQAVCNQQLTRCRLSRASERSDARILAGSRSATFAGPRVKRYHGANRVMRRK